MEGYAKCDIVRRNCLQLHVTEGKIKGGIEVKGRRRRKLLDDLKEEALDRKMWRAHSLWKKLGPVRQTTK
jgi:hypothetical protein